MNWIVVGSKRTHISKRAVSQQPIVDVAQIVGQFDQVDQTLRELMHVNWLVIKSKRCTHKVRRAADRQPIVDVAGLVW